LKFPYPWLVDVSHLFLALFVILSLYFKASVSEELKFPYPWLVDVSNLFLALS
jgi:hypothetical protein